MTLEFRRFQLIDKMDIITHQLVKFLSVYPLKFIIELYSLSIFSVAKLILPLKKTCGCINLKCNWLVIVEIHLKMDRRNTIFATLAYPVMELKTGIFLVPVIVTVKKVSRSRVNIILATFIWDDHHCNNDINKWCFIPVSLVHVITCTYFKVFFETLTLSWGSLILRFGLGITDMSSLLSLSDICVLNLFLNEIEFVLVHKIVQTTLTLVH